MLNDEDKKELAKLVAKELKTNRPEYLGMSKSEIAKAEKKKELSDRQVKLQFLKDYNRDTLAQRIELEKIKFQNTKAGRVTNITGKVTGEVAKLAGGLGSAVLGSKASKGLADALLYSNPITALIAQNMDLFKGVGKVGLQGLKLGGKAAFGTASFLYKTLRRPKGFPKSSSAAENVLTSKKQDNNYVLTKSAVFIGGKNYLMLGSGLGNGLGGGAFTALTGKQDLLEDKIGAPKLLTDKKSTASIMKKGLDGIEENVKKGNKFLDLLNKKNMLILGAILLGAAGIAGLIAWLKSKFGGDTTPNIDANMQSEAFKKSSTLTAPDYNKIINEAISKESKVSKWEEMQKLPAFKGGRALGNVLKLKSGYSIQSEEGSPYRAPFDLVVINKFENIKKLNTVNLIVRRLKGIRESELMNIQNCIAIVGQVYKKGDILGTIAPGGKIQIKDINKDELDSYVSDINKYAESKDKVSFSLDEQEASKISSEYNKLARSKQMDPNEVAEVKGIGYNEQQAKFSELNNQLAIESLKKAIDNNYNGTMLEGRWIPKSELQGELNKRTQQMVSNAQSKQTSPTSIKKKPQKGTPTGFAAPITTSMNVTSSTKLQYSANDPSSEQAKIANIIRAE